MDRAAFISGLMEFGQITDFETRLRRKDGTLITVIDSARTIELQGKPCILSIIYDITERKQAEEEKRKLLNIIEASLNEIYIFDVNTLKFSYVNEAALQNTGYSSEEARELTPLDLKPEFTENTFREMVAPLLSGEKKILVFQTVHRRKDASLYPVEVHLQIVQTGLERVFLAIIYDITERKHAEEELKESERKLKQAQQIANVGYWENDFIADRITGSEEAHRIFGLQSDVTIISNAQFLRINSSR